MNGDNFPISISDEFDYKGFMEMFQEAERTGTVDSCFNSLFNKWKDSLDECVALTLTLNHLMWIHHEQGEKEYYRKYNDMWSKLFNYALKHYKGQQLCAYQLAFDDING